MDTVSRERRSEIMGRIKGRNTRPELRVRSLLHRLGYRFRLHRKDLPGTPDLVLPKFQTILFVHGCFWHGCTKCDKGLRIPKTNREFWVDKVAGNRARDEKVKRALESSGWRVATIWECETADIQNLERFLRCTLSPTTRNPADKP